MVAIEFSRSESERFGRRVARAILRDESDVAALCAAFARDDHDLLIVRYPARMVKAFAELSAIDGCAAIFADTLMYFRWDDRGEAIDTELPVLSRDGMEPSTIASVVAEIFAGYVNHYVANPRLDPGVVAVGYSEWAASVAADPSNVVVGNRVGDEVAGLAVVDARGPTWDVVLAGVTPAHRGRGAYADLMRSVMSAARAHGQRSVLISTQSHNVQVMRTWERLGWRVVSATVTTHLERTRSGSSAGPGAFPLSG